MTRLTDEKLRRLRAWANLRSARDPEISLTPETLIALLDEVEAGRAGDAARWWEIRVTTKEGPTGNVRWWSRDKAAAVNMLQVFQAKASAPIGYSLVCCTPETKPADGGEAV